MDETETTIEWCDPPQDRLRRVDQVMAELKGRPGQWARIESGPNTLFPWWVGISASSLFEMKVVRHDPNAVLSPRDVYARYIGSE